MAFFKFRKGGDRQQTAASIHPESVEAMRRRAKHRLIGAAVLVIAGVVGFPLVFDTQPRPIAVDVPIVIPDKNSVKPLTMPAAAPAVAAATSSTATSSASTSSTVTPAVPAATDKVPATAALSPKEEIVSSPPKSPAATAAVTPPAAPKPATVAAASKPVPAAAPAKTSDGAKALALLEGKAPEAASASGSASDSGRFVVQVGAFADADKAREARMKVERSGMKTYTQVADTKDGKRTRVRVGPFASRAEADKAAAKIKGLDLSAAVLTL